MSVLMKMTCPHCWHTFDSHSVLWVSTHQGLYGDPRLPREPRRFLPTRFTADGFAVDEMGSACHQIACPACHLEIPRVAAELDQWIVSVIGSPASGKSFYLGALIHTLRSLLPAEFRVSFTDSDTRLNGTVLGYEQAMFGSAASRNLIRLGELIQKTQQAGEWYNTVMYDTAEVQYPIPFMFTVRPLPNHPHLTDPTSAARVLCLYDNAGESYLAGGDSTAAPVTRHLAKASLLLFLYDPTQDHTFRERHIERGGAVPEDGRVFLRPQQAILTEAANRVRMYTNMSATQKYDKPLFVIVTKQDLWGHLVPPAAGEKPLILPTATGVGLVNLDRMMRASAGIEKMLRDLRSPIVDAAEAFCRQVIYVGVSSLGVKPTPDEGGHWAVKPCDIKPTGVEAPILYGLNQLLPGLFPSGRQVSTKPTGR